MSDDQQQPPIGQLDDQLATTSDQPTYESVKQAAARLGISENAVRLRVKRGTLPGVKIGDNWFLVVGDQSVMSQPTTTEQSADQRPSTTSRQSISDQSVVVADVQQAIAEANERYAADMRVMFDEVGRIYQAQLAAKDETIGELRRRAEAAESRLSALEAANGSPVQDPSAPQTATDAGTGHASKPRQRKWWLRLFGVDE